MPVVLGIDQARSSGWAVVRGDRVLAMGRSTTTAKRLAAVREALALTGGCTLVGVVEDHSGFVMSRGKKRRTDTLLGMGDKRGRWLELLALHGVRACMVSPDLWRPAVLGVPKSTRTDPAKDAAVTWATRLVGSQGDGAEWSLGEDECEALAIAWWGAHSPQVAELAAMRRLRPLLGGVST